MSDLGRNEERKNILRTRIVNGEEQFQVHPAMLALMRSDPAQAFARLVDAAAGARDLDDGHVVTLEERRVVAGMLFKLYGLPVPPTEDAR
jgi:hypothetical protein